MMNLGTRIINNLLILKSLNMVPIEIVKFICNLYLNLHQKYTLFTFTCDKCSICNKLTENYDDIKNLLLISYPILDFHKINVDYENLHLSETTINNILRQHDDRLIKSNNKIFSIKFRNSDIIMNFILVPIMIKTTLASHIREEHKYDITDPNSYVTWITDLISSNALII